MHIIHKVYNLDELRLIIKQFKDNNYAYISYIIGEYGIVNSIYKIITYNFYLKMKEMGIKTVAFVLKGMKQFAYNCCDEIIEYQDIEINDNTNEIGIFSNNGYYGNDGTAKEYIFGMRSKNYEFILKSMSFSNLFYTLHCDGTHLYNNFSTYDETYTINFLVNLCNRTKQDLQFFMWPPSAMSIIKDPIPLYKTIQEAGDVITAAVNYIESPENRTFQSGIHRGDSKLWKEIKDLLPIFAAIQSTESTMSKVFGQDAYRYTDKR